MAATSERRLPMTSPPANTTPAAQPTVAPVLDYSCLFTHDLKRKQKRWQDGRLKFHTFNKRIMVYDERGNFIGDMHWREDDHFEEGEEFQLERGCVIVQVSECLGSRNQDLTELLDKRYQEKEQRHARTVAAAAATPARPAHRPDVSRLPRQPLLANIPNAHRGSPLGRAVVPALSPYEQRLLQAQTAVVQDESSRPAKRRKAEMSPPSKSGYAQNLFGATLSLSTWTSNTQESHIRRPLLGRGQPPSAPKATASFDAPRDVSRRAPDTSVPYEPAGICYGDRVSAHSTCPAPKKSPVAVALQTFKTTRSEDAATPDDQRSLFPDGDSEELSHRRAGARLFESTQAKPTRQGAAKKRSLARPSRAVPDVSETVYRSGSLDNRRKIAEKSEVSAKSSGGPATASAEEEPNRGTLVSNTKRSKRKGLLIASKKSSDEIRDGDHTANSNSKASPKLSGKPSTSQGGENSKLKEKGHDAASQGSETDVPQLLEPKSTVRSKKRREKEEDECELIDARPRLAIMRRSVKSKEVLGLQSAVDQLCERSAPPKQDGATAEPDDHTILGSREGPKHQGGNVDIQQRAGNAPTMLRNPATRNRKAAKESDAAGQAPQSILPTVPATISGIKPKSKADDGTTATNSGDGPPRNVGAKGPETNDAKLPGFSRASGGPWSKSAHDLLGITRPVV